MLRAVVTFPASAGIASCDSLFGAMTAEDFDVVRRVLTNYMDEKEFIVSESQIHPDDIPDCEVVSTPGSHSLDSRLLQSAGTNSTESDSTASDSSSSQSGSGSTSESSLTSSLSGWTFSLLYVFDIEGLVGETVLLVSVASSW